MPPPSAPPAASRARPLAPLRARLVIACAAAPLWQRAEPLRPERWPESSEALLASAGGAALLAAVASLAWPGLRARRLEVLCAAAALAEVRGVCSRA